MLIIVKGIIKVKMSKKIVLTGLRTNGEYHLGNYLGALMPMVHMANSRADEYQINLFAPDLHSFTTPIDNSKLFEQTMHNIKLFIACGMPVDHNNVFIYRQSKIPAHSELTIILNNFSYMGELSRMTQYKDKSDGQNNVSVGLFDYPVLMASDILLYDTSFVPVGEDQRQHIEFTRDLAIRFNNKFGEVFTLPEDMKSQQAFVDRDAAPRIRSLRDPSKKMSKSIDDPAGTILLTEKPSEARKKIMSATTDSVGSVSFDWDNQPGITNLLQILALLSEESQDAINAKWTGNERYGDLKTAVADAVCKKLEEIQHNLDKVDERQLEELLNRSELEMNNHAIKTLIRVQKAVGLRA